MLAIKYKHVIQSAYHVLHFPVPQMFTAMSKWISSGLPVSKHLALVHQRPNFYQPAKLNQEDGMEANTVQQSQMEDKSPSAKSYFCFAIEYDPSSCMEVPMTQTVQSIVKSILQSQEGMSAIPSSVQDLFPVWSNNAFPGKQNTRLMCVYIYQGSILPASFSGKLLIGHPSKVDLLSSSAKALGNSTKVRMSHAKFGIRKVLDIGILGGTFQQECQQAMSHSLESSMCLLEGGHHTPLLQLFETQCVSMRTPTPFPRPSL
jgi:hypothetical protein